MSNRQTIISSLFSSRKGLSDTMLRSLTVRGSGIQINNALRRFTWNGVSGAATTVMNVNGDTSRVEGVRFETRGKGPDISFQAKNLWKGAQEGITVTVKLNDLSRLKWKNKGAERNQR